MGEGRIVDEQADDGVEQIPHVELVGNRAGQEDGGILSGNDEVSDPLAHDRVPVALVPVDGAPAPARVDDQGAGLTVPPGAEPVLVGVVGDLAPPDQFPLHGRLACAGYAGDPEQRHGTSVPRDPVPRRSRLVMVEWLRRSQAAWTS